MFYSRPFTGVEFDKVIMYTYNNIGTIVFFVLYKI